MKLCLLTAIPILLIAGCTTTNEIIIDQAGVNMQLYEQNLAECRTYAKQVAVARKTAKGAASGAAIGGAVSAVSDHGDIAEGAAIGAISGGSRGLDEGERSKVRVVKNCLRGRGYRVLN